MLILRFTSFIGAGVSLIAAAYTFALYSQPVNVETSESQAQLLCETLVERFKNAGFSGSVSELDEITGSQESFKNGVVRDFRPAQDDQVSVLVSSLRMIVNSELSGRMKGFQSGESERKQALKKVNQVLKEKEWSNKSPELKWDAPEFFLNSRWQWEVLNESIRLSVRVTRISATASFVEATQIFLLPGFVERTNQIRDEKLRYCLISAVFFVVFLAFIVYLRKNQNG